MNETTQSPGTLGRRWLAARTIAGYGAAGTMSLYLVVKVIWVVAALLGDGRGDTWGTTDWVVLNLVTVVMSAVGVALGLALAQPWGQRVPAPAVILFAWVAGGFLVPLLPFLVLSVALGAMGVEDASGDTGGSGGGEVIPVWETVFISVGFVGMAAGLAVALPIYMWQRWPYAFSGSLGVRPRAPRRLRRMLVHAVLLVTIAFALLKLWWALGGTLGLSPAHLDDVGLTARMLNASWGIWALIGSGVLWLLTTHRPVGGVARWLPMTLGFAASGSMFAWSGWRLPLALLQPGGSATPEYLAVAVAQHLASIGAGAMILTVLVSVAAGHATKPVSAPRGIAVDDMVRR